MDSMVTSLIITVIDLYIVFLFVRMFATSSERYDAVLGMIFRATDPIIVPLTNSLRARSPRFTPIIAIAAAVLLKGLLLRSIPSALQSFANTLFQLYVFIIIIIAAVQEFYVNPIASFGQRIVRPVRMVAASFTQQRATLNIVTIVGLILAHTAVTLVLHGMFSNVGGLAPKNAFVYSLTLVLDLTWYFSLAIIINALLSWVSPDPLNPIVQLLALISAPIIEPLRRIVPPVGGMIDLSPMIAIFALMIANELGRNLLRLL